MRNDRNSAGFVDEPMARVLTLQRVSIWLLHDLESHDELAGT